MTKREIFIDYAKAIMIFLVVPYHAGLKDINLIFPIPNILVTCMFCFFFIAGYTYTPGRAPLGTGIKRRFQGIYLPFIKIIVITALLELIRGAYLCYGNSEIWMPCLYYGIYGSGLVPTQLPFQSKMVSLTADWNCLHPYNITTPLTGHLWFLPAMFTGCALYIIYMEKIRKRRWFDLLAIAILLFIAGLEGPNLPQLPFALGRGCLASACMIVARNAKEWEIFTKPSRKMWWALPSLVIYCLANANIPSYSRFVVSNYAGGVFLAFLNGISGAIVFLYLFQLVEKFVKSPTLQFVGQSTMTIYLWHIIFNTIYSLIVLKATGNPIVMDRYKVVLLAPGSYGSIIVVAILTLITTIAMAKYKSSHEGSLLAKII